MARMWHKPGVLMTAYLLLFVAAEAWATMTSPASGSLRQIADMSSLPIAAFLAWRVSRGGWFSRGLIIVYTAGVMQKLLWSTDMTSGGLVSVELLAICLAQIALLVSAPVYERTRKDWAGRPPSTARLWPAPPWWLAAVALVVGLLITLASLGSEDFWFVPCAPPPPATPARCTTLAQGFPVHFLATIPSSGFAAPVIYRAAAAEDMAIWTVLSFAAGYLIWLPSRRPAESTAAHVAAPI